MLKTKKAGDKAVRKDASLSYAKAS